jgi:hypothetical protein
VKRRPLGVHEHLFGRIRVMVMNKKGILRVLLIISGIIQIGYWGISHLFFPQWYLQSVGLTDLAVNPGSTVVFLNEIGVLAIGMGLASILASFDPIKNIVIIIVLYVDGIGSMFVSLYHILVGSMASGEWITILIIAIQIALLTIYYPWSELRKRNLSL